MEYRTIEKTARAEMTVKKSRFIATIAPADSEAAARDIITAVKKEFYDARHNCSAWVLGADKSRQRSSDDGEPGGTAGQPILSAIVKNDLTDLVIVVTRYFGGVKLGAAGLARAYGDAAVNAIRAASLLKVGEQRKIAVNIAYDRLAPLENMLRVQPVTVAGIEYADAVTVNLLVAPEKADAIKKAVSDLTAGRAQITDAGTATVAVPLAAGE